MKYPIALCFEAEELYQLFCATRFYAIRACTEPNHAEVRAVYERVKAKWLELPAEIRAAQGLAAPRRRGKNSPARDRRHAQRG